MNHLEDCDGNGDVLCWQCGGQGFLADDEDDIIGHECGMCHGSGNIMCPACKEQYPEEPDDDDSR